MGFCRRCGDIVFGPRCKCGGSAVAPVVNWSSAEESSAADRWSKTYVTKQETATPTVQPTFTGSGNTPRKFPRPISSGSSSPVSLNSQISAHIHSATSSRPTSPLKHPNGPDTRLDEAKAEEGILPSPYNSELAKVYGSVLQPKETLSSFACAICLTPFPPDATIYPDPCNVNASGVDTSSDRAATRFLCRPCFSSNGGSRGECEGCQRPVLILKSEGGFVENGGRVWHKRCFDCDGCGENIGDHPMVDLLGRPSCTKCFDSCLNRPSREDAPRSSRRGADSTIGNLGGSMRDSKSEDQAGSPTLEELELRLGITRNTPTASASTSLADWKPNTAAPSRGRARTDSAASTNYSSPSDIPARRTVESFLARKDSPQLHDSPTGNRSSYRRSLTGGITAEIGSSTSQTRSPRASIVGSTKPTEEAIEEMKQRFLSGSGSPATTPRKHASSGVSTPTRRSRSRSRPRTGLSDEPSARPRESLTPKKDRGFSEENSGAPNRYLRSSSSMSSLRLRSQRTGDTVTDFGLDTDVGNDSGLEQYRILPDRTGESTQPLRIRRNNTGTTTASLARDITGSTNAISEHSTGDTEYVTAQETGATSRSLEPQRTGEPVKSHKTGERVPRQHTGERRIRRQRTGDPETRTQGTGGSDHSPIRRERTGDGYVRRQRTDDADTPTVRRRDYTGETAAAEFGLRKDRTGDAEVESLLGAVASLATGDLIDLSPSPEPIVALSRIPQRVASGIPSRQDGDYRSNLELGFNTSSSSGSSLTSSGYESSVSSTPDLTSDFSDAVSTRSAGPSTPPSFSPPNNSSSKASNSDRYTSQSRNITPTPRSRAKSLGQGLGFSSASGLPRDERCASCMLPLFSVKHGGKFVTVPEEPSSSGAAPKRYHTSCFKCKVCGEVFEEKEGGHAVFVRVEEGACHVHCAPPEKITLRKNAASAIPKLSKTPLSATSTGKSSPPPAPRTTAYYSTSSRYEAPAVTAHFTGTTPTPQPRFGGSSTCLGCLKAVSPMERGVVPGPQGSKWHAGCLICGGIQAKGKRKQPGKAGCGKKLDSGAKVDAEGGVWCRECLLLLPPHLRQASPLKSPIAPTTTGSTGNRPFSMVAPQTTGTTLARQFTGFGGGGSGGGTDNDVLKQLTGGGLSPTRQLASSPTKMFDGPRPGAGRYPRPKSVIGTRSTSGGEGRGMFLVRQLTGGNTSFSGNEYGL